jgi:HAD superfamily hydrolase (TIGR01549 family)
LSRECDGFLEKGPTGEREHLTPFESRIVCLCERIGLRLPMGAVADIADHVAGAWEEHVRLDADASRVLTALRREKPLALVSNFDHPRHLRKVIAIHRLTPLFRSIVISGEIGVKKPDPRIFGRALEETGLTPREVVYVGDTEEDIVGARAAGITPILIRRFDNRTDGAALDFASDTDTASDHGRPTMLDVTTIASLNELLTLLL